MDMKTTVRMHLSLDAKEITLLVWRDKFSRCFSPIRATAVTQLPNKSLHLLVQVLSMDTYSAKYISVLKGCPKFEAHRAAFFRCS